MLHLPDITLVVLAGDRIALTELALADVVAKFAFEDILVFGNAPVPGFETVVTPMTTIENATRVAWRDVYPRLNTTHGLWMQWDGYPTTPAMWTRDFQGFDFIGAVWPWFRERSVGNTGFSLQSKRFLGALLDFEPRQPEDITLCRDYRLGLEERGIKFAIEAYASWFSREYWPIGEKTFGFHGLWNMLDFLDDERMKERLSLLTPQQWRGQPVSILSYRCLEQRRRELYLWVEERRAENCT